ncbi:hypothetical protein BRD17_07850 [Halobacteriales archaeon SW_7_68_16]|nr:MAG: hypothetical protein BRD17_07850 [Halobacteriales archaeon SW_7_68_16]
MSPLSYLEFLVVFVVAPTLGLMALGGFPARRRTPRAGLPGRRRTAGVGLAIMIVAALVYTIPWDNYLIGQGVWWYGESVVALRLGLMPIGEYSFIIAQSCLAAAWLYRLEWPDRVRLAPDWTRSLTTAGLLALTVAGVGLLAWQRTYYLGAILAWGAPVIALQTAVGAHYLLGAPRFVATAVLVPSVYLWAIDHLAIGWGLWVISPAHTTGLTLLGLPIEEAIFFLLTDAMVVQGLVLFHWVVETRRYEWLVDRWRKVRVVPAWR